MSTFKLCFYGEITKLSVKNPRIPALIRLLSYRDESVELSILL